jgi:hypothetical protein
VQVTPSAALVQELDQIVAQVDPEPVALRVYLLPDSLHFDSGAGARSMSLDLRSFKRWREAGSPDTGVTLGETRFTLETGPEATDDARLALLVWKGDVPLDELVVRVCIGSPSPTCGAPAVIPTADQTDPVRPILGDAPQPDASLHLVELRAGDSSTMVGLFKERGRKPVSWELDATADELRDHLSGTLAKAFAASASAETEAGMREDGWILFNLLFPWSDDPDQRRANATFADFVRRHQGRTPPSTLFGRVAMARGTALELPLGLMALKEEQRGAVPVPIGLGMKVESPLPRQSYRSTACPRAWRLLLPVPGKDYGDGGALGAAVAATGLSPEKLPWKGPSFVTQWDFEEFRSWLEGTTRDPATVLLLVSHHGNNAVWFDKGRPLASPTIRRSFGEPSIAILDGCGTAEPGAAEVVHALNRRGVEAAIATATSVGGKMAGEYVRCLLEQVKKAPAGGAPLSALHFDALACLQKASGDTGPYGARALVFGLLGNGAVNLCKPQESP